MGKHSLMQRYQIKMKRDNAAAASYREWLDAMEKVVEGFLERRAAARWALRKIRKAEWINEMLPRPDHVKTDRELIESSPVECEIDLHGEGLRTGNLVAAFDANGALYGFIALGENGPARWYDVVGAKRLQAPPPQPTDEAIRAKQKFACRIAR